jgi:signal transduction histidine kinase/ActR/RegA family two-component response regulator
MLKRIAAEIRIISLILVVLLIVLFTAVLGYRGFRDIVNDVSQSAKPEIKLALLNEIASEITAAESSIKSYSLTRNAVFLSPFYKSVVAVELNMEKLRPLAADNAAEKKILDRMSTLIDNKYALLNELLALHADESIMDELTRIADKIEIEINKAQSLAAGFQQETIARKEEKKRNVFKRFFSRKEKSPEVVPAGGDSASRVTLARAKYKIKKEIVRLNEAHVNAISRLKQQELALTEKNEALSNELRRIVVAFDAAEKKLISEKIKRAGQKAGETNFLIAIFCGMAGLLLLTTSFVIINYVIKRNALNNELRQARDKAEALARAREIFLANMSHEIRTPMNAITGFTRQVLQTSLTDQQRGQLEIIKKSQEHLLHIINDILDYSKLEAGKFRFVEIDFDLKETIDDTITLANMLVKKGVALEVKGNEYCAFKGDPVRLRQILMNLLSNAVKFTEQGRITLTVSVAQVNDGFMLQARVSDTGIGIPKDKIAQVLQEYQQTDDSVFMKYGGTGLGLPLTKKLVELQGGTLRIDSEEGKGTQITFTIPYRKGEMKQALAEEPVASETDALKDVRVLIADDDAFNRMLLCAILARWQVKVSEAGNGREALEALIKSEYDIILMDARMPEMNGLEATAAIRKLENTTKARIPVIALTAATSEEILNECRQSGMDDVLSKPFDEDELQRRMIALLGLRNGQPQRST